ncbi:Ribonuclease H-like protein [Moelleriella libera RCEF 2490]|uniref:Ribonuclease H-like protein n=1 Tax=Moelleriella libera RCEF 2490 TaxID=1081109 RepID=A0A166V9Z8_9HYPO|nr:Ribonuclease H-like protein [Moelleriella libera RCEF 2490]
MGLALKYIPCPAGILCTAYECIFGHDVDSSNSDVPLAATTGRDGSPVTTGRESSPAPEGAPRKRIKVDSGSAIPDQSAQSPKHFAEKKENKFSSNYQNPSRGIEQQTNLYQNPSRGIGQQTNLDKARVPKPQSWHRGQTSTKLAGASAQEGKPESLNPRLLKNSPASHETRMKLLRMLHAEFTRLNRELNAAKKPDDQKLVMTNHDMIVRALDEEEATALDKPAVYANVMKHKIMHFKRMKLAQWKEARITETSISKEPADGGVKPVEIKTGLTSAQEVQLLPRLITEVDDLPDAFVVSIPSEEDIRKARNGVEASQGWETCNRCRQRFQVFPGRREEDGALTTGGKCNFHWGKDYFPSQPAGEAPLPRRYQCCGQDVGESPGCSTHDTHVFKVEDGKRLAAVLNYAATPENAAAPTDRAVCFDCEMGFTVHGMELIRLTATAWPSGDELLDVLVQPVGEILDLNSRFSGVWPNDLANAPSWTPMDPNARPWTPTRPRAECFKVPSPNKRPLTPTQLSPNKRPLTPTRLNPNARPWTPTDPNPPTPLTSRQSDNTDVKAGLDKGKGKLKKQLKKVASPVVARDLLFRLIAPTTPLIGHGLENDLNAVRVVHPVLIDTAILYPHRRGLPSRNSLKYLMSTKLQKEIQKETALGHDSAEDARAAGELVRLRVMLEWQDMQMIGWRVIDGKIWSPSQIEEKLTQGSVKASSA